MEPLIRWANVCFKDSILKYNGGPRNVRGAKDKSKCSLACFRRWMAASILILWLCPMLYNHPLCTFLAQFSILTRGLFARYSLFLLGRTSCAGPLKTMHSLLHVFALISLAIWDISGVSAQEQCPEGTATVVYVESVKANAVYVSQFFDSNTVIVIDEFENITISNAPTDFVATITATFSSTASFISTLTPGDIVTLGGS